jgi:Glycosyltransferases involved in cell wall biogenesis
MDTPNNDYEYLVSIRLMTFNHENFIEDAMNGIMNQRISFKMEVVVGDDFSGDNTLEKIRQYKSTSNIHIRILDRKEGDEYHSNRQKLGRLYNFYDILKNCSGKYIALLDGDDYWCDPLKIEKQVQFLEENQDYLFSFHDCKVFSSSGCVLKQSKLGEKRRRDWLPGQLVQGAAMPTMSVMFRAHLVSNIPSQFFKVANGDTFLFSYWGQFGKAGFLESIEPGMYRVHEGGVWSKVATAKKLENYLFTFQNLELVVSSPHKPAVRKKVSKIATTLALEYFRSRNWSKFFPSYSYAVSKCAANLNFKSIGKLHAVLLLGKSAKGNV